MVKTGYASDFNRKNPRPANSGTVILITTGRRFPWLDCDEHIRELSPDRGPKDEWMRSKKTPKDWKRYLDKFFPKMKGEAAVSKIKELRSRSDNGETITLLCYCKPGQHCHRDIIKAMIEK